MSKRTFLILGLALFAWTSMQAAQVSETQAKAIAAQFMFQKGMGPVAASRPAKAPRRGAQTSSQDAAYYVFNANQDKGFVVASGDDRALPILGYSDTGSFDPQDVPENMQWWLDLYVAEISSLDAASPEVDKLAQQGLGVAYAGSTTTAVAPLIKSTWGQRAPFYFQCPQISGNYCVTGCVATAMAQIMYYHKWPTTTSTTIPAYTTRTSGISMPALSTTTFAWSSMKDAYEDTETSTTATANAAVAKLLLYCGQSVNMNYGTKSSGAGDYSEPFVKYFRYSTAARKLKRSDYTRAQWETFILNELAGKRPVMYGGMKASGGHSFVCDGYDGNGYFHFNWGWYGSQNGYFALTSLNPENGGTGSIAGEDGYTIDQDIIIGLQPNTVSTSAKNSVLTILDNVTTTKTSFTRSSTSSNFSVGEITAKYWNPSPVSGIYDVGWQLFTTAGNAVGQVKTVYSNVTLDPTYYRTAKTTFSFGSGMANGTYYLKPVSRESGTSTWYPCHNSGTEFFLVTINGTSLTLKQMSAGATGNYTASINSYGLVRKVGRPLEVKVNLYNNTKSDVADVYLFVNNSLMGGNAVQVNPNSSAIASLHYEPTASGTNSIKICADEAGSIVLCTGSVTVAAATTESLTLSSHSVTGAINNVVKGTSLSLNATFKNGKSSTYTDYVVAYIYKQKGTTSNYGYLSQMSMPISISGSSTNSTTFKFEHLDPAKYLFVIYYYSGSSLVKLQQTQAYTLQAGSAFKQGDVNGDGSVSGADVTALYNRLLNNTAVAGNADVNGDGVVNGGDVTALYSILLK